MCVNVSVQRRREATRSRASNTNPYRPRVQKKQSLTILPTRVEPVKAYMFSAKLPKRTRPGTVSLVGVHQQLGLHNPRLHRFTFVHITNLRL